MHPEWMTAVHPKRPPAYILENVAMQHNFNHEHIRYTIYEELCARLGDPVTFDAAQVGSHAHRMRITGPTWRATPSCRAY